MASSTALLPILLLLTFSLGFPDQPSPPEQDIASLASASSSIPTSTLPSPFNTLASAPIPALITGPHEIPVTPPRPLLVDEALLVQRDPQPTSKSSAGNTITIAQTTRPTITNKTTNSTLTNTALPGNETTNTNSTAMPSNKTTNSTTTKRVGGNATVLPPEPRFTSARPKSEAGRDVVGSRMMGMGMGALVVVGMGVWGGMVLL